VRKRAPGAACSDDSELAVFTGFAPWQIAQITLPRSARANAAQRLLRSARTPAAGFDPFALSCAKRQSPRCRYRRKNLERQTHRNSGGASSHSIANHIGDVLRALRVKLVL